MSSIENIRTELYEAIKNGCRHEVDVLRQKLEIEIMEFSRAGPDESKIEAAKHNMKRGRKEM